MRIETGPLQFGDDWPGVFLRGDYAIPMAMYLASAVDALKKVNPKSLEALYLESFIKILQSCDIIDNKTVEAQKCYKADDCLTDLKCVKCDKEAEFTSPKPLCQDHWSKWWDSEEDDV